MGAIKLKNNVYSVGVLNPGLRVFDIIMDSKYGTSYNAFLITGEKNVLIDTVHEPFFGEYLNNIQEVVDVSKIDCLIMNHTEPDHSGSVAKLLSINPNITVYCTIAAQKYLSAITNRKFECVTVRQGDKLSFGSGELEFIIAPLLHWPDSMFTWMPSEKTLFTCDFLGTHYCEPTLMDTGVHYPEQYWKEFRYYYDGIFSPFKPYVLAGLDKIKDIPAELICTSHGPCLTASIEKCKSLYREWSTPSAHEKKTAAILYASAYSCTAKLAQAAYDELKQNEQLDVRLADVVFTPFEEVARLVNEADALMIGSCTINRDAPKIIWDVLSCIDAINTRQKPAGAFGSYGWSGEAVPMMKSRLEHLKFRFIGDGLRVNFMPTEEDLAAVRAYARELAANIKA
ncbi:MAG: FprA family A-type flavoprotein [Clostridiales bacterium]|jgi:flavorubredoxin|nr:FprA family A-type flavoprotein [Clostridiales bacterium]